MRSAESASSVPNLAKLLQKQIVSHGKLAEVLPRFKERLFRAERLLTILVNINKHAETVARVRGAILAYCRRTVYSVCDIAGQSYETVHNVVSNILNIRCGSTKFVPRLPSFAVFLFVLNSH